MRETGVVKLACYFTPEDIFQSGTYTTTYGGILGFNSDSMQFFIHDEYNSYGGFEYNISLDSGWSFLFVEGMGNNLFGVEVNIQTGDILEFRPTITPQNNNSHVSLSSPSYGRYCDKHSHPVLVVLCVIRGIHRGKHGHQNFAH